MENEERYQMKKEYTDSFLTRQGKKILFYIERCPGIYSRDLAGKLRIQKNSMSNAMERLRGSQYELVYSKTEGRQKRYYLTEWGESYTRENLNTPEMIKECLGSEEDRLKSQPDQDMKTTWEKAVECIDDLRRISSEWEMEFLEYLCSEDECTDAEMKVLFQEFMQSLQELFFTESGEGIQTVLDKISSEKVRKKTLACLDRKCGLVPLWNWAEEAGEEAYQFIDELFDDRKIVLSYEFIQAYEKYEISEELYRQIAIGLMRFIDSARKEKLNKAEFYNRIVEQNPQCDWRLGYYIAEKYRELRKNMEK